MKDFRAYVKYELDEPKTPQTDQPASILGVELNSYLNSRWQFTPSFLKLFRQAIDSFTVFSMNA